MKHHSFSVWFLIIGACIIVGCRHQPEKQDSAAEIQDRDFSAFASSGTFEKIEAAGFIPATIGERDPDSPLPYFPVQAGVNTPERFDTWEHLRIYEDGRVERLALAENEWVNDVSSIPQKIKPTMQDAVRNQQ